MKNFALIGAAGFVAPRHLAAIRDTGNRLIAAVDPHDSVGLLDRFFPEARFFIEVERFDRFLEKQRRKGEAERAHVISICSPNYLHDAHVRLALRVGADALCEKPLVISPWNLDQLAELEAESGRRVYTVLQLRCHPAVLAFKQRLEARPERSTTDVVLTYVTRRGPWYHVSWKGSPEKSGGPAMNIGVHFFDLLLWLFGPVEGSELHLSTPQKMAGALLLRRARVRWYLSVDAADLPARRAADLPARRAADDDGRPDAQPPGAERPTGGRSAGERPAYRSLLVDGEEVEFSEGFADLHTRVYQATLGGHGFSIEDARPSIELVHRIRQSRVVAPSESAHPLLQR